MKRIITAVIILPFLIASILISWLQLVFVLLIAAALLLGLWEFRTLARKRSMKPVDEAMFLGAAGLFVVFYFNDSGQELFSLQLIVAILILLTICTLAAATFRGAPFDAIISSAGATILGVLYIVLLGGHLVALRTGFPQQLSAHLLSFFFLVVMGADAGAYYVGRAFGKHKLAPKISPGKTWEGAAGGLLAGVLLAAISHFWFFKNLPLKWAMPLGALMTALGMIGDLTESALKRSVGAKDAAKLLPGHGGMLDRLDSLLFNAPLIYYFARIYFQA
ncbi:MAG TPA: phosphatidate cytidylyltransferase [Pyrinomonadaceae bacterium]|nr:phosphatidate cytidylyltransferase [Pyrinomonadaceae bacterium]